MSCTSAYNQPYLQFNVGDDSSIEATIAPITSYELPEVGGTLLRINLPVIADTVIVFLNSVPLPRKKTDVKSYGVNYNDTYTDINFWLGADMALENNDLIQIYFGYLS